MSELAWVGRELVRVTIRRHVVRYNVHARHFVLLFPLHPPILEPDLDLTFSQAKGMGDLDTAPPRQVAIEVKLLFQFERLIPGVRRPLPFHLAVCVYRACQTNQLICYYVVFSCDA